MPWTISLFLGLLSLGSGSISPRCSPGSSLWHFLLSNILHKRKPLLLYRIQIQTHIPPSYLVLSWNMALQRQHKWPADRGFCLAGPVSLCLTDPWPASPHLTWAKGQGITWGENLDCHLQKREQMQRKSAVHWWQGIALFTSTWVLPLEEKAADKGRLLDSSSLVPPFLINTVIEKAFRKTRIVCG